MHLPDPFGALSAFEPAPPARGPKRGIVLLTLLAGSACLAATLHTRPGSPGFNLLGLAVAAIWCGGAAAAGPPRLRTSPPSVRRTVLVALLVGAGSFLAFLLADLVGRHLPLISPALHSVLTRADTGNKAVLLAVALLNGIGEEMFFRGVVYDSLRAYRPVLSSTVVYVVVTATTGNVALIVAATIMGLVFALERRSSRGILAPTLTHLSWATLMLFCLPR